MFNINYNTGISDTEESLELAMSTADENATYTQENITIEDEEGNIVAIRRWWGCLSGIEECEDPIRFGDYGYYEDWQEE